MLRIVPRAALLATGIALAISLVPVTGAIAHSGAPRDGRIPGEPDFQRIGKMEFQFHPDARAYTYKPRPGAKPQWFHFDNFAAATGASYALPSSEESVVCATSGHRIRVAYVSTTSPATPTTAERDAILNIVRRMNWKIAQEALRSSGNNNIRAMRVDCDTNRQIRIHTFTSSGAGYPEIVAAAKSALGEPTAQDSVKNLIFFDGSHPGGAGVGGIGGLYDHVLKSSADIGGNYNRTTTTSAVVYNPPVLGPLGYWDTHVSIHELTHAMGGVQTSAPFATANHHCTDGIDILCYPDAAGVPYSETRCPANGYFDTPSGTPLDCTYDSYFDALEENGEWLKTFWNVGGTENPFLVQPDYFLSDSNSSGPANYVYTVDTKLPSDIPISGDWNGDGYDTAGFYRPSNSTWYLRNSNVSGPADIVFQFGLNNARPVTGDWNGDGTDTVGIYYPNNGVFYLSTGNVYGASSHVFAYGNNEDLPIAGDWDKNGTETIGLYRPSTGVFFLSNANATVPPAYSFAYGNPGNDDLPVAGDWDENGYDSVGVYRQSNGTWYLDNEVPGNQPISYVHGFGVTGHARPLVGDWNNSGTDTAGAGWK